MQDELLKFLSLTRMLYWPQVHWLKLMTVMVGSINQVSPFSFFLSVFFPSWCDSIFNLNLQHQFSLLQRIQKLEVLRNGSAALRASDRRAWRWTGTGAVMALPGMLQISRRARLQRWTDLFRWQKSHVSLEPLKVSTTIFIFSWMFALASLSQNQIRWSFGKRNKNAKHSS